MFKKTLFLSFLLALAVLCQAQNEQTAKPDLIDPTLNEIQNEFLNKQAEALLNEAGRVFTKYPPAWPEPEARKSALLLLDGVLHDVYAHHRPPVQDFFKTRMQKAIDEIEQIEISDGARIWKLYNHSFVVRTNSVTIGFDLASGISSRVKEFSLSDEDMSRLAMQCDVLFVSHYHGDHAEESVARLFIDQGKPVVAPAGVWKDKAIYEQIVHLDREAHKIQELSIQKGQQRLKLIVYPGHQGTEIDNNVYLVYTPEGLSFSHMGDQSNSDDFQWIDKIGTKHQVDVLMPNCWTTDIVRVASGFDPELIITGHENEMGHTIDHREPYWLSYQRREGSDRFGGSKDVGYDTPVLLMTWGESYQYK